MCDCIMENSTHYFIQGIGTIQNKQFEIIQNSYECSPNILS